MAQIESSTNLSSLALNLMEDSQFTDAVSSGQIDENQIYMTPADAYKSLGFDFFVDTDGDLCIRYDE